MLSGDLHDPVPPLGNPHHSANGGHISLSQIADGHTIGGDHEVLDDLFGPVGLLH
jgi:hypothetical protein